MRNRSVKEFVLLFWLALIGIDANCQSQNLISFLEPNLAIKYDSNYFKQTSYFTNDTYHRQSLSFLHVSKSIGKSSIMLSCWPKGSGLEIKNIDSSLISSEQIASRRAPEIAIVSANKVQTINNFRYLVTIIKSRTEPWAGVIIRAVRVDDQGTCELVYTSTKTQTADYKNDLALVKDFLGDIIFLSKDQIKIEDSIVRATTIISFDSSKVGSKNLEIRDDAVFGKINVSLPKDYLLKELHIADPNLESSYRVIYPDSPTQMSISIPKLDRPSSQRLCELIVESKLKRPIRIPFELY